MAAPSYTEDLTDVTLAESTTGWTAYGGGASGLGVGPDLSMEGTNCVDKQVSNADKGQYFDNGSGITLGTGDHVFVWVFNSTPGITATWQNKGTSVFIGTGSTAYCQYHMDGSDTYGAIARVARCYVVDYSVRSSTTSPPYRTVTGSPGANPQLFGGGLVTTATVRGTNCGIDAIRYGTGAYLTAGELVSAGDASDNPCTFTGFATQNDSVSLRWGILTSRGAGQFELQGRFVIGQNNAKTATLARFKDSNKTLLLIDTKHGASDFTQVILDHASTRVEWTNINLLALGTTNPGRLVVNSNNPTFVDTGGTCTGIGITTLRSNTTSDGRTWRDCDQITANGAIVKNAVITGYTGTANTSALVWDTATDPDGKLDGSVYTMGTTSTHAIEFGTTSPTTMTLRNIDFSGYGSTDNANDSTFHFKRTTGSVTLNVIGCTGNFSYRTDGATIDVVENPRTVKVKTQTAAGAAVTGATVHLHATAGLPYQASVTITRSGTTATVTHTSHGLSTNDKVEIEGITDKTEDNERHTITVTGANTYTYTTTDSGSTSYTGTITSTFVFFHGTTDGSGEISLSRVIPSSVTASGWARKATASPYYKEGPINGPVSNTADTTFTAVMLEDE